MIKLNFFAFLFLGLNLFAQTDKQELIELQIESQIFHDNRKVNIWLPPGYYDEDSTKKYPVAYLFDGQFEPYFNMVRSMMSYYIQTGYGVPMILVSIHSTNRSLELTPAIQDEVDRTYYQGTYGNADTLSEFIRKELDPYIEANFRIQPYRLGIGHSLGGTYVFNEFFKQNSFFKGCIAVSPNLEYDHNQLVNKGKQYFVDHPLSNAFLFSSVGNAPGMETGFRASLQSLDSIVNSCNLKEINWYCNYLDGKNHMSTFPETFNDAYLELSKKWILTYEEFQEVMSDSTISISQYVDDFYSNLSDFTGFQIEPQKNEFLRYIQILQNEGNYKEALKMTDKALLKFPEDVELLNSKAMCYYNLEQFRHVKEYKQKALDALIKNKDKFDTSEFNQWNERLQKTINYYSDSLIKYKELISNAKKASSQGDFKLANELLTEAFNYPTYNGTHIDRMNAVPILTKAGNVELAFKQLDVLANHFKWRGRNVFENNDDLMLLKSDERWGHFMQIFDRNLLSD